MSTPIILTDLNNNPIGINPDRISMFFVPQNRDYTYVTAGTQQFSVLNTPEDIMQKIPFVPVTLVLAVAETPIYINRELYIAFFERNGSTYINSNVEFQVTESVTQIQQVLSQGNEIIA